MLMAVSQPSNEQGVHLVEQLRRALDRARQLVDERVGRRHAAVKDGSMLQMCVANNREQAKTDLAPTVSC